MNDLLSSPVYPLAFHDLEAGVNGTQIASLSYENSLSRFFLEVGCIKGEMEKIRQLLVRLQSAHEEGKTVTNAQTMKALRDRMDADIAEVLLKARSIKAKLDALDKANEENRRVPGCEKGSSTDRTRMLLTNSLRRILKNIMDDFQSFRQKTGSEYRETIERRYYTITGQTADEETIDRMIETGESETFLQRAVREQGRGQIIETIKEIKERHDAVKQIEKNLLELHQIFLDMAVLVDLQDDQLNNIEAAVQGASSYVKRGSEQLHVAKKLQKSSRKWMCIAIIILLIIILVVILSVITSMKSTSSS